MTDARAVYQKLREEITTGALPPGAPLREIPLARRFGVSRTPVREALRRLEQDRLLVPGERGARTFAGRSRDGIPVPPPVWKELSALAGRLGVAMVPNKGDS